MDRVVGSVSQSPKLYTRRPYRNLAEQSSIPSHLSMGERVIREQARDRQPLAQEAAARYIEAVRRVNTAKESEMARTPYVTVRGSEPAPPAPKPRETPMAYQEPAKEEDTGPEPPAPVEFDYEVVNELLDVVHNTADLPNLIVLNQQAMAKLVGIAKEVQDKVDEAQEEYQKAQAEWNSKKAAEAKAKAEKEAKDAA